MTSQAVKILYISLSFNTESSNAFNPILGGLFLHPILGGGGQICPPT